MPADAGLPTIEPMLATSARHLPEEPGWAYELKWDGIRAIGYVEESGVRFVSRNGNDLTARWPPLQALAAELPGRAAVLDGEVVAFDAEGRPSFSALQQAGDRPAPVAYLVFDLLHLDGRSLLELPWQDRRALLEALDLRGACVQTPAVHVDGGPELLAASRASGLEGVVAKRRASSYQPGKRSRDWIKVKNVRRQELVIGGWLEGSGHRAGRIGALLLGYHDGTGLRFAGKVGTGFTDAELERLGGMLADRARPTSPFVDRVPHKGSQWVEPELVAEIEFSEWTHLGTLRAPSYKGLRPDKPATDVVRED